MKYLASVTIVMSIPTMVASFYGMNVNSAGMPFSDSIFGFAIVIVISLLITLVVAMIFWKRELF
jgi:magnesium transporter